MITAGDVFSFLETIAPEARKEPWDNTGFQFGRKDKPISRILVALDPFEDVASEAIEVHADMIITHHPLIFRPITAVTSGTSVGRTILALASHDIAACSAHTNLDTAPFGVNDVLAKTLSLKEITVVEPNSTDESGNPWGLLRCGTVAEQTLEDFLEHVKKALHTPVLRFCRGGNNVHRVLVGGGACANEYAAAVKLGCDTFVSSDAKYNDFWDARDLGINLIDAGHFYTENPVCDYLCSCLHQAFPETEVILSQKHRDCMEFF